MPDGNPAPFRLVIAAYYSSNLLKVEKYNNDIQLDDRYKLMTRHYANGYVSINAQKGAPRVRMRSDGRRYDGIGMRRTRFDV